jgi:hypothetical protein
MSNFVVVVVPEQKEVSTTKEETTVVVNPLPDSSVEVVAPVSDVLVSEESVQIEVLQNIPFTIDIIESYQCCDLEGVDIPSLSVSKIYDEDMVKFQLVSATSPTNVGIAGITSLTEATVLGIALEAGLTGDEKRITILGVVEDASFTWAVNAPLFLGASGLITNTPPVATGEFVTQIGYSLGTGAIFVSISEPMEIV